MNTDNNDITREFVNVQSNDDEQLNVEDIDILVRFIKNNPENPLKSQVKTFLNMINHNEFNGKKMNISNAKKNLILKELKKEYLANIELQKKIEEDEIDKINKLKKEIEIQNKLEAKEKKRFEKMKRIKEKEDKKKMRETRIPGVINDNNPFLDNLNVNKSNDADVSLFEMDSINKERKTTVKNDNSKINIVKKDSKEGRIKELKNMLGKGIIKK